MRRLFVLFPLALSLLTGCPREAATDTGATDVPAQIDAPAAVDAPTGTDTPTAMDTPGSVDVPVAVDVPAVLDTPGNDSGGRTASCAPGPCPPECFVANRCVVECGGPETNCGCCDCGAGSINVFSCP